MMDVLMLYFLFNVFDLNKIKISTLLSNKDHYRVDHARKKSEMSCVVKKKTSKIFFMSG